MSPKKVVKPSRTAVLQDAVGNFVRRMPIAEAEAAAATGRLYRFSHENDLRNPIFRVYSPERPVPPARLSPSALGVPDVSALVDRLVFKRKISQERMERLIGHQALPEEGHGRNAERGTPGAR